MRNSSVDQTVDVAQLETLAKDREQIVGLGRDKAYEALIASGFAYEGRIGIWEDQVLTRGMQRAYEHVNHKEAELRVIWNLRREIYRMRRITWTLWTCFCVMAMLLAMRILWR